jgi:hypothetical protein
MTVKNVLIEARDLIINKGWTQKVFARDEFNNRISQYDKSACSYCMIGACRTAAMRHNVGPISALNALKNAINHPFISVWNDNPYRTKEEVIEAFNKAIDLCE